MNKGLQGKVALVTGSAHRVGRGIALALASRGCDLVVHYHQAADQAQQTLSQASTFGVQAVAVQADLSAFEGVMAIFQTVDENFGGLDLLVNSAAVLQRVDLLAVSETDWQHTIDLNLKGAFFCLQQAALRMRARGGGAIVNVSDVGGLVPWKRFPVHSISKAGLEMLTKVSALALAPEIRVNAVAPGPVLKPDWMSEDRWSEIGKSLPLGHAGDVEDVARAVVFLFENEFITGETIIVDGGNRIA